MRTVPEKLARPQYDLKSGDVLVCTTNSAELVGKCAFFDLTERYVFSNHLTRLRTEPGEFDGRYLRWYLWLQWRTGIFDDKCKHWVNQSTIPKDALVETEVAVAPLAEQRRIACKVEALLAKARSSQDRLDKIPIILKRFRQAVLAAACSGRLTADWRTQTRAEALCAPALVNRREKVVVEELFETPDYWRWVPLNSLFDSRRSICYGVIKLGAEEPDGVPCLRTSDVKPLRIDTVSVKRIAPAISDEYRRTLLQGDEILVNVRGTLGGVAVVPPSLKGWNISREVPVVPIAGVLTQFVAFWIASLPCQNWLSGVAKGVAYTGINIEDLKQLPVAIPSLAEQEEIVRRALALFAVADKIEARHAKAKAQVDRLTQSVLAKAFRGELVPTEAELARREGRSYETAEELLARIKDEQAKPVAVRRGSQNGARRYARR